jgi:hypothetical protein
MSPPSTLKLDEEQPKTQAGLAQENGFAPACFSEVD